MFPTIRFCSNFTSMWFKYLSKIFAGNLPLKLFRATVANADIGSFKYLYTLSDMYLDHILEKFEAIHIIRNVQNFEVLDKNGSSLKPF